MASLLSHEDWVRAAQDLYDGAEKSGADYTRLSTVRRKIERLLRDAGVEEPAAVAAEIVSHVRSDAGADN